MRCHPSLCVALTVLSLSSFAQVALDARPASALAALPELRAEVELPAPDVASLLAEDERNGFFPARYGTVLDTWIDFERAAQWDVAPDGTLVARVAIRSSGAHSLGLEFARFDLPRGANLFVLDPDGTRHLGAYGEHDENPDGRFVIQPFAGEVAIVELDLPPNATEFDLVVDGVIHDYRDVFDMLDAIPLSAQSGGDGACLVDVNCAQGQAWQDVKRSVVRTLSGGGFCSAVVINNTKNDATGYVLTANHCGQGGDTVFLFNYEAPSCGAAGVGNQTVSGCTVLANNGGNDGRLLRINGPIPASYQPYFAGWSRSTHAPMQGTCIGHPSGKPKKIAADLNGVNAGTNTWNAHWQFGMLEGGSSGSALFDENGHVRGQAWWVTNFFCGAQGSGFGRFDKFFSTNALAQWLAPGTPAPDELNAYDPYVTTGPGPVITSIAPGSVAAFASVLVTLTGVGFSGATSVTVGTTVLTSPGGFTVLSDTALQFDSPAPVALGATDVTVSTPLGTTAPKALTYKHTLPPQLAVAPSVAVGTPFAFAFGGGKLDVAVLVWSPSTTTFPLLGVNVLLDAVVLKVQFLDALGLGNHVAVAPASAAGLTIHAQLVDVDEVSGALVGATVPTPITFTP
jgi:hypothetical protein